MDRPEPAYYGVVEFLVWPLLGLGVLALAETFATRAGLQIPDSLTGSVFYAAWGVWVVRRARRAGVGLDLRALVVPPADRGEWTFLLLVVPLVVVSVAALYLVMLVGSFVAPRIVAGWLVGPAPPQGIQVPTALAFSGLVAENALGAVAEELVFRGVLLHLWARRFGIRFAVLATSLLFAAMHADVIGSLIFGIVMAALYLRTRTLLLPIVAHFLFNVLVDLVALFDPDRETAMTLAEFRSDWWQAVLAFAGAVAVIVVVMRRALPEGWRMREGG